MMESRTQNTNCLYFEFVISVSSIQKVDRHSSGVGSEALPKRSRLPAGRPLLTLGRRAPFHRGWVRPMTRADAGNLAAGRGAATGNMRLQRPPWPPRQTLDIVVIGDVSYLDIECLEDAYALVLMSVLSLKSS